MKQIAKQALSRLKSLIGLALLVLVLSLLSPHFLTTENLLNITRQVAVNAILATGMTFVIISAGIDLSVGSVLALSGCVMAIALNAGVGIFPGILLAVGVGSLCGLANGFMTGFLRVPPFIATLGMMSIARGLALVVTGGYPIFELPEGFSYLGTGYLWDVLPVSLLFTILVVVAAHFVLTRMKLGRYVYVIGGNEEAAVLSGVNVRTTKMLIYTICGFLAGLASVVFVSRLNSAQPTAGIAYELDAIAATVIGGTSLFGGVGSIGGTVIGALIMGVLRNGLNLLNVSSFWQQVVIGVVIITAVYVDQLRHRN
ncbi:MAG: ABC transporter permease [Acidobacteriota bacterium]